MAGIRSDSVGNFFFFFFPLYNNRCEVVTSIYISISQSREKRKRTPLYYNNKNPMKSEERIKKKSEVTMWYYDKDVTRTELSADPVKKMGRVGCQSTAVIGAPCGSVLHPLN